ncbi:MAG TPA: T9SS type A sorting domain-containing protein, partial [Saprospiraceae bacterium]|nr:T9SS type A sorting domain-containing protein [Saprospiraceae bacterium]
VRCFGEANGSAALTVSGGVAPYSYLWDVGAQTTPEINQLPAGQYTCAITDNNGCQSQAVVQVSQPDALTVTNTQIVNASGTEQNNGSITIEVAGGTAPYSVVWSNGATGTSILGLVPGEYSYTITDVNGCIWSNASAPVVITGTVSTTTPEWSEFISIVPNPSKGNVMVSWKGLTNGNGTMTLLNLAGQRLLSKTITSGTGNWDLSAAALSSGVYIVLFEMNGEAAPFKLVVL